MSPNTEAQAQRGSALGDGARFCSYADLPEMYGRVEAFIADQHIDQDACIALHCGNTLPSAIVILSLLSRGTGLALCPPNRAVPKFCRYTIDCDGLGDPSTESTSPWNLLNGLRLRENLGWHRADGAYRGRIYVQTSGSTADAKTVLFTHDKMWANARNCVDRFQLSQDDRVAIPVPLSHMYGFAAALLPAVLAESAVDIQADSNVIRYLQHEAEFEPTTVYLTPSFCYALVRLQQAKRPYRLTVSAGDKTPPDIFRRYEDAHGCLVSLYGSTELGAVAAGSPDDPIQLRADSTGRPMPGVLVSHAVEPAEDDAATSELCFDHPAGGEGYADARGEVIQNDPRFLAGRLMSCDVGRLGADGYLRVAGRSDHLVKRDGRLVALGDVEGALLKNHSVEAAVVLSDGFTPRGAQLTAVCVARDHGADGRSLRDATRQHLPAYAVPDRVILIDRIPRLESGKADRAALTRYVADADKAAL